MYCNRLKFSSTCNCPRASAAQSRHAHMKANLIRRENHGGDIRSAGAAAQCCPESLRHLLGRALLLGLRNGFDERGVPRASDCFRRRANRAVVAEFDKAPADDLEQSWLTANALALGVDDLAAPQIDDPALVGGHCLHGTV